MFIQELCCELPLVCRYDYWRASIWRDLRLCIGNVKNPAKRNGRKGGYQLMLWPEISSGDWLWNFNYYLPSSMKVSESTQTSCMFFNCYRDWGISYSFFGLIKEAWHTFHKILFHNVFSYGNYRAATLHHKMTPGARWNGIPWRTKHQLLLERLKMSKTFMWTSSAWSF